MYICKVRYVKTAKQNIKKCLLHYCGPKPHVNSNFSTLLVLSLVCNKAISIRRLKAIELYIFKKMIEIACIRNNLIITPSICLRLICRSMNLFFIN